MNYLLKRQKELLGKKRKGFTLVELLVVIAILAVLASVSVVGYLGFTTKAKQSNALNELAQAREVIRAELIGGSQSYSKKDGIVVKTSTTTEKVVSSYTIEFSYSKDDTSNKMKLTYSVKSVTTDETSTSLVSTYQDVTTSTNYTLTWDSVLKACFSDLKDLGGTFSVGLNTSPTTQIDSITYKSTQGGIAKWIIADDGLDTVSEEGNESTVVTL